MAGAHPPPCVLVTDAEQRAVIAAMRGLDEDGFSVGAVAARGSAPGLWSRSCDARFPGAPSPNEAGAFVARLAKIASASRWDLLMAGTDLALWAVSRYRSALEGVVELALPPHETVERAFDRTVLEELAADAGLVSAPSVICADTDEALAAVEELGLPVLLKPVRTVAETPHGLERWSSVLVDRRQTLAERVPSFAGPVMVQRQDRGPVVSFAGVMGAGRLLGSAFSRYLRTWRPEAGNAACSVTEAAPEGLARRVESTMRAMGWEGLFELELIRHADGSLSPIDLNPRVYGSMGVAVAAGANLPALWARWARGESPAPVTARPGVRYRWEEAEVRHLLWQLHRRRWGAARALTRPAPGTVHAYARSDDPGPMVARIAEAGGTLVRRWASRG